MDVGSSTPRFPVIVGATASGKSDVAVEVALLLRRRAGRAGEIVSADSIQVYRGMDIGSAKPTEEERRGVAHHVIDVIEPTEPFSVDAWLERAEEAIAQIRGRGNVPVVVGGTHLYIKAFLEGLFDGPQPDERLRAALAALAPEVRRAELERVDPAAAARIHPNDARRTIRALEVYRLTGRPISDHQREWDAGRERTDCLLFGLEWATPLLNQRINERVKRMMARGLLDETRRLEEAGHLGAQAREALGYKQLLAHLRGELSLEESVEKIKIETRRFAKNQRTWMRRLRSTPDSTWMTMKDLEPAECAQVIVSKILE